MTDRLTNDLDFTQMEDGKNTNMPSVDDAVESFFDTLDEQVNGMVLDEQVAEPATQRAADPVSRTEQSEPVIPHRNPEEDYKKRYADSSREAKELKRRVDELEPFAPILERMRRDPNLIGVVRNYLEGGAEPSTQLRDKLELPEDFIFDGEAAFKDPSSDSAKVLQASIESVVQKNLSRVQEAQRVENARERNFDEFRKRNKIEGEELEDLKKYADEHDLTWDDILYLKNREKREKEIAAQAREESNAQREKTRSTPTSLADRASAADDKPKSAEDTVFDAILQVDNGVEDLLSLEG